MCSMISYDLWLQYGALLQLTLPLCSGAPVKVGELQQEV
jgi:hypothetical protein